MASAASTGNSSFNSRVFTRGNTAEIVARALGREMRRQKQTNEKLERLTGIPERRIEALRSFTEESPIYLEDVLELAMVLGPQFLSGILSEVNMYAAEYTGHSPEKLAAEAIELLKQITGGKDA